MPSTGDRAHALRVGVGLLVPGVLLVALGRPDLIIFAAFGSFTGMYGRSESRSLRLLHQSQGAGLLLAGTTAGLLLSGDDAGPLLVTAVAVLFAIGGSMLADFFGLVPEGPFYSIFALGAIAGLPAGLVDPLAGFAITLASAGFALLLGLCAGSAGAAGSAGFRGPAGRAGPAAQPSARAFRERRVRDRRSAFVHAGRYAVAVAAAGFLADAAGLSHVNWAIAGAAVTLAAADPHGRLRRGVNRVVGTMLGLVVTAGLLLPGLDPRGLALIVIVLLFPTELFMSVNYALALSFFTPMIMLMTELADPIAPAELLRTRALGTMLGVLCGLAVGYGVRDRTRGSSVAS